MTEILATIPRATHDRVNYKLGVMMLRCLQGQAPANSMECCHSVSNIVARQCLYFLSTLTYLAAGSTHLDVRHLQSRVRQPGTCRTTSDIVTVAIVNSFMSVYALRTFLFAKYCNISQESRIPRPLPASVAKFSKSLSWIVWRLHSVRHYQVFFAKKSLVFGPNIQSHYGRLSQFALIR